MEITTLENFKTAYVAVMMEHPEYKFSEADAIKTANRMIEKVKTTTYRADWLRTNPAMRIAAKRIGIISSPQLRDFIKARA